MGSQCSMQFISQISHSRDQGTVPGREVGRWTGRRRVVTPHRAMSSWKSEVGVHAELELSSSCGNLQKH